MQLQRVSTVLYIPLAASLALAKPASMCALQLEAAERFPQRLLCACWVLPHRRAMPCNASATRCQHTPASAQTVHLCLDNHRQHGRRCPCLLESALAIRDCPEFQQPERVLEMSTHDQ